LSLLKRLEQIVILGWVNSLPMLRQPMQMVTLIIFAALPIFYMWALGGMHLLSVGLAAAMISLVSMSGTFVSGDIIFNRIWTKYQDILVASPVSPICYMLGIAVSNFISVGFGLIPFSALLLLQGKLTASNAASIFLPLGICYLSNLMLGFYLGTVINDVKTGNSLGNVLILALVYLPPVYYPLTALPDFLRFPALLIPTVSTAQIVSSALGMSTAVAEYVPMAWVVLVLSSIVFGTLTLRNVRWRER